MRRIRSTNVMLPLLRVLAFLLLAWAATTECYAPFSSVLLPLLASEEERPAPPEESHQSDVEATCDHGRPRRKRDYAPGLCHAPLLNTERCHALGIFSISPGFLTGQHAVPIPLRC